jgi:hypothetical protein
MRGEKNLLYIHVKIGKKEGTVKLHIIFSYTTHC